MRELATRLIEEVHLLEDALGGARPSVVNVRTIAGPFVRKWLIDPGGFDRIERAIKPEKIKFIYNIDRAAISNIKRGLYEHWAGGFFYFNFWCDHRKFKSERHAREAKRERDLRIVAEPISAYLNQTVCYVGGSVFSRRQVVKFHVNNLGGAHYSAGKYKAKDTDKALIIETLGFEVSDGGTIERYLFGPEISEAKSDPARRSKIYDLADLILLDTARTFLRFVIENDEPIKRLMDAET
ncbi:hypothetical protein VWX96_17315 [Phaeobacter sp. A90a-4f]|uniref:hypothetical protein n=1 Tax=unclassified Phaeobacter TaxID=2621772 RepID=UPI003A8689CC